MRDAWHNIVQALERARVRAEGYRAALRAIRGALRLEAALNDPEIRAMLLEEIRVIVEEVLGEHEAANDRERRDG